MYCPIQKEQLSQVVRSGWLYPFAWTDPECAFWQGNNLVFFENPYCFDKVQDQIWIVIAEDVVKSWQGGKIGYDNQERIITFESGIPVVLGVAKLVVATEALRDSVIDLMSDYDVVSKWSDQGTRNFIYVLSEELHLRALRSIATNPSMFSEEQRIRTERHRAVALQDLLLSVEAYKAEERYWAKFLDCLQVLRDNKKLLEDEDSPELREAKKLLQQATRYKAENIHLRMVSDEIARFRLKNNEVDIHKFLVQVLGVTDYTANLQELIYRVLYKMVPQEYKKKINVGVRDWLTQQKDFGVWSLLAQLQKKPYDPVIHGDIRSAVKKKVAEEKIPFIREYLLASSQWNFDYGKLSSVIIDVLINDTSNLFGVELLRRGMSETHRKDMVEKVVNTARAVGIEQEAIFALNDIQQAEQSSFRRYTNIPPEYDKEVNSFLAFLLSPLDAKRIGEQCSVWKNTDIRLSLIFHAALIGYENLSGAQFHPFWDSIQSDPKIAERICSYLIEVEKSTAQTTTESVLNKPLNEENRIETMALEMIVDEKSLATEKLLPEPELDILSLIKSSKAGITVAALSKKTLMSEEELMKQLEQLANAGRVSRPSAKKKSWTYIYP
jgi:hypothetical protein